MGKTQRFDKREGEAGAIESRGNPLSRSGGCMYVHMLFGYVYDGRYPLEIHMGYQSFYVCIYVDM